MPLALDGVKILDLSRLLPGPFATGILADLGADVLKVEDTVKGDYTRWAPPYVGNDSAQFMALNRNKRSMKLNLKHADGPEILLRLARRHDVLVEQFRPGVMDRLGVGYDRLREVNPTLIYCAITGYGQDGPYRDRAGHDLNYLSIAGVTGISGPRDGLPAISGVQIADVGGGALMAAVGVLAALHHRDRTGEGQFVDISMMDGALSWMSMLIARFGADGLVPEREALPLNGGFPCYRVYETKDGRHMSLGALEPQFWEAFLGAIGREDLANDSMAEGARRDEVVADLAAVFRSRTRDEWVELLKGVDCCCEPVLDLSETWAHPQVRHRRMILEADHPQAGKVRLAGFPIKLSATPACLRSLSPGYGEHTDEVLKELGYSETEIARLKSEGVC